LAGRLDVEELDERLGRALQARTRRELHATLEGLPPTHGSSLTERLATMSQGRATTAIVTVLAVALWATGHLGADAMMIVVAGPLLLLIWRRPRSRRT